MNKKGEEETGRVGAVLTTVLVVVVLVIVFLSLYLIFTGKFFPFANYLPGFNQTKPPIVENELFKYNISSDLLQYYDGINWVVFPKEIEVNRNKFDNETVKADLIASFIGRETVIQDNPKITAAILPALEFTSVGGGFYRLYNLITDKGKTVFYLYGGMIDLRVYPAGGIEHLYILSDNALYEWPDKNSLMKKVDLKDQREYVKIGINVTDKAINWRNDLLNNSVTIHYKDQNGQAQSVATCYIKSHYTNDNALVVDLSRPKDGLTCPYLT